MDLSVLGLGIALAVGGVGGLIGALAATRLGARFGAGRVVIASHAGMALAVAVVAMSSAHWTGWIVFGVGEFALGLSMGVENANSMGYRQSITPDHLQGRSNATMRSINRAMIVVGAPLGGLLADAIGFRVVLWLSVAGFLMVATGLSVTPYRHARLNDAPTPSPRREQRWRGRAADSMGSASAMPRTRSTALPNPTVNGRPWSRRRT